MIGYLTFPKICFGGMPFKGHGAHLLLWNGEVSKEHACTLMLVHMEHTFFNIPFTISTE
jgi:hypothetical protein